MDDYLEFQPKGLPGDARNDQPLVGVSWDVAVPSYLETPTQKEIMISSTPLIKPRFLP